MPLPSSRLGPGLASDSNSNKQQITTAWPSSDTTYAAGNLVNQNNVAEGPNIPPPQSGSFRVPRPSAFRVTAQTPTSVGEIISFSWLDAEKPITEVAGYRLFARFSYTQNAEPTQIGTSSKSPCIARITADTVGTVVFFLQPFLLNGLTLPLTECPTCTITVVSPVPPSGTTPGGVTEVFDAGTNWTCPAGVTSVFVQCWGSGGTGGASDTANGGGGGGGAYAAKTFPVTPTTVYIVHVDVGGSEGSSWFDAPATVLAISGKNGVDAVGTMPGAGGVGGDSASCIGDTVSSGASGQSGAVSSYSGGAGLPGGGVASAPGIAANAPGGGGGGGIHTGPAAVTGADGRVSLTYTIV